MRLIFFLQLLFFVLNANSQNNRNRIADPANELKKHTDQICQLASDNQVGLVDSYKAFEFLYPDKEKLQHYMSQVNHPNELGHELIANEIITWFK